MSGPKVVRVVTREEVLAICNGLLARVDAALQAWIQSGKRHGHIDDSDIAAYVARRDQLARLIATDRLLELQKQAPLEEAFLRDDIQVRRDAAAEKAAKARAARRQESEAAKNVLQQLNALPGSVDPEVIKALERGDTSAISQGFRLLAEHAATSLKSTSGFAAALQTGLPETVFSDWLASQPPQPSDPAIERIENRLNELEQVSESQDIAKWRGRLTEAPTASPARCQLLLDGLEIDTGRALTVLRRRAALVLDVQLALAELSAAGADPNVIEDLQQLDQNSLEAHLADTRNRLETLRSASAAQARRAAVLQGLAKLGYEITEDMTTSTVQDGRLVFRSATRPDYGVEVGATTGSERLQLRPVAFDSGGKGPDPARDRDAETIWCGDVSALQAHIAAIGGDLAIERALPVGATPLKRITVAFGSQVREDVVPALKSQKLP